MTDSLSAAYEAIDEYEALCKHYGIKPVIEKIGTYYGPNPYCKHAEELRKKHRNNKIRKRKK
jgi:hypothetical protein